jgi:hypothetical protein
MSVFARPAAIVGLSVAFGLGQAAAQSSGSTPAASPSVKVGTLEVRDVAFATPGQGTGSIERIAFTGFVRTGDRVRAERINIDKVVIAVGTRAVEIPSIVISGADLPAPLVRAVTTGEPPADLAGLMTSAVIDQIAIERIVVRDPATQTEIVYANIVFGGLKAGHIAAIRLGSTAASMIAPPGEKVEVRSGEVRYQQFDLAEIVRMVTGGGSGGAKRILQRAVVDGMEVTTAKASIRINRVELSDLDGRAPAQPLPIGRGLQAGPGAAPMSPEQQKQAAAFAADILRYARIGRYSIEGISVSTPGQGTFGLGAVTIAGLSGRGIERIEVRDFDFRMPVGRASFERFDLEGINYGGLIEAALEAASAGRKFEPPPGRMAQLMPRLSAIRLSRLNLDTPQGPVELGDLRFELEELSEATSLSYAIRGLKVDLRRLPANDGRDKLIGLGYGELIASMQARVNWQRNNRALTVETVGPLLEQVGRLELSVRLDNVDLDQILANPDAAQNILNQARFGLVQVKLADLGLAERFYAEAARSAGVSPDAIRAGLAAEMRSQAIGNLGPLLAAGAADALAEFLRSPGTITARLAPVAGRPPPSVAEIQSGGPPAIMQGFSLSLHAGPR